MEYRRALAILAALALPLLPAAASAKMLKFAGHVWKVRPNGVGGPRDNHWCQGNAFVDKNGALHLRMTYRGGRWCSAQVTSVERMGFGTYEWKLARRVDDLDPNVVFGLYHYPTADLGPDGTREIDIEFTRWGKPEAGALNYTVWPNEVGRPQETRALPIALKGEESVHRYRWSPAEVAFASDDGAPPTPETAIARWTFAPPSPEQTIAREAMPVNMNLWMIAPPAERRTVEVVISGFSFRPLQ